ncbi:MAG TPA: class I adenylate-forming enzyme family protein [Casimicrobiaceae bacterium]|nr:class I adenylate-forming enzyme family protein [Casimicrobiaceae bacterium]
MSGRSVSGREIVELSTRRSACYADLGLRRFDRVFLHHGNSIEFFADLLAVWHLGACAIPIDPRLTPFEVETLAAAAKPRLSIRCDITEAPATSATLPGARVLSTGEAGERARRFSVTMAPACGASLDDDALILFTSGTTGEPKGVVHTHRSLRSRWSSLDASLGLDAFSRTLCVLPTHFGHGLICNCLFPWLSGRDLYVAPPFTLPILSRLGAMVDEFEITFMSSVPTVWRLALKVAAPPRTATLERVCCGSAPLSAALWNSVRAWTGASDVLNAYGITETGSWLAGTTPPNVTPEDGLVGVAWGGELKILESGSTRTSPAAAKACAHRQSGHVWIKTPALMRGYLDRDDLTQRAVRDGWFSTGDIGYMDERGALYLEGREREEINKGGTKIHPGDVDNVVERFDGVLDVCTFGCDDVLHGQNVAIAVVLNACDDETLCRLRAWTQRHLAAHQFPQRWYVVPSLPRSARGKVSRDAVARLCAPLEPVDLRTHVAGAADDVAARRFSRVQPDVPRS